MRVLQETQALPFSRADVQVLALPQSRYFAGFHAKSGRIRSSKLGIQRTVRSADETRLGEADVQVAFAFFFLINLEPRVE